MIPPDSIVTRPAASGGSRRYFVETWGCQMNELDSQRLGGQLMQEGFVPTREVSDADIILLNSCSVRENAQNKVYSRLGGYRLLKQDRPWLKIGLCGCVAQQEGERALDRVAELDFVLGTGRVGELRDVLRRCREGERVVATGFPVERDFALDAISRDGQFKGMITVVEGCDKRCTFCVVPTTRGPERSRSLEEIVAEARHLVEYGFLEIELLGQTVNHWRDAARNLDFADLLDAVATVGGVERLRFVTSYPRDFTARMIAAFARHRNICPYLHLPVQSGSDSVLRRMGRGYTRDEYWALVVALRAARPETALSTDFIVGFPGETEEDFEATLDLARAVRFSTAFSFKYSPRPGTAAPRLGPPVDEAVAESRLQRLFAVQDRIQRELNEHLVGQEIEVLVTGPGRATDSVVGRSACHRVVNVSVRNQRPEVLGRLLRVRVDRAFSHSLAAQQIA